MQLCYRLLLSTFFLQAGLCYSNNTKKKEDANTSTVKNIDCEKMPVSKQLEMWLKVNCFFKAKNYPKSIENLHKLVAEYPSEIEAYVFSSFLNRELGNQYTGEVKEKYYKESVEDLEKATALQPENWKIYKDMGDHYYLFEQKPENAHRYYMLARKFYEGGKSIPKATNGEKSAIEDRIARTNEALSRRGDAVTATCISLMYDPDNKEAQQRLEKLGGACKRKNFRK
jgi:tetratricopeptide (TPR) repeat protein